jgi:glycosyltransferase involved in cell wall biosynthesis
LISPVYPDTEGNGLAMRAGMFLEALAQKHRVSLLAVPVFNQRSDTSGPFMAEHCAEMFEVAVGVDHSQLGRFQKRAEQLPLLRHFASLAKPAAAALAGRRFDVIHAMRLYTAPLALQLAKGTNARLHLDLDDIESTTHSRLAELYRFNLRQVEAAREQKDATLYAEAEQRLVPQFDRVYVCSEEDAASIAAIRRPEEVKVIPNAVRLPDTLPRRRTTHPFRFLFVGTLGYYPNEDAVRFFCTEIVPLLRRQAVQPFQVRIVGTGLSNALMPLTRIPEVRLIGRVGDIGLEYGDADAVVVPIRAGGGMRIKVLEAFAYRRPVVSTTVGIEGITAEVGDYLRGDTPEELAAQCLRLMREPALGEKLATNAAGLVETRYTQESVNRLIAALS